MNGVFPLVWMLLTSLKPEGELSRLPITYFPDAVTLSNYATVLGLNPNDPSPKPFWRWFGNSALISLVSAGLCVWISSQVAYVIARMNIRGRGVILAVIAGISMFPLITLIVPLFQTMRALGLLNTHLALIIPYTVLSLPVCTLMMVGFFQQIPRDLENAAMVDGCTRAQALWKVVFPLSAPGVFTAAILAFVNAWEEFLLALTLIQREDMRTLAVGITLYQGEFAFPWALISAALVLAMVPVAVVVVMFQDRVVSGLTAGGVKG
ncbi:carbohydrate ABC transporter permease [Deinococcus peraridilitoris]|nr:carbohydrate ABC transporter permease [Deinococcus peraridilitoris]